MAEEKTKKEKEKKNLSPQEMVLQMLNENKKDHLAFVDTVEYVTSTSSLIFDLVLDGGFGPGSIRAIGQSSGGKSHLCLAVLRNFLEAKDGTRRRGIYFPSEGRLSNKVKDRCGVKFIEGKDFTENPALWVDGTCLIIDSNIYELIFTMIRNLITTNPEGIIYNFIIDSADMLIKRSDMEKPFEESNQVAGGALLTSTFFKKAASLLSKGGHRIMFISQKRTFIKVDPKQKTPQMQGGSSGPQALIHQADWVLDFMERTDFDGDFIREKPDDKNSEIIGHWCKIKIIKSDNEKNNRIIKYPIKYGRTDGNSVWIEYEIVDLLLQFGMLIKGGAWFSFSPETVEEVQQANLGELPKIQGLFNVCQFFEDNKELTTYFYEKFKKALQTK